LAARLQGRAAPAMRAALAQGRRRTQRPRLEHARPGGVRDHPRQVRASPWAHRACREAQREALRAEMPRGLTARSPAALPQAAAARVSAVARGAEPSRPMRFSRATAGGDAPPRPSRAADGGDPAGPCRGTHARARDQRLAARRGQTRAVIAVAHAMGGRACPRRSRHAPSQALGRNAGDEPRRHPLVPRVTRRLEPLGSRVTREWGPATAAAVIVKVGSGWLFICFRSAFSCLLFSPQCWSLPMSSCAPFPWRGQPCQLSRHWLCASQRARRQNLVVFVPYKGNDSN
jgi:hypothetical protein